MSGLIRKLIGPVKTRLQRYVEEASSLLSSGVEEKYILCKIFEITIITSSIYFVGIISHCIILLGISRLLCIL